MTKQTEIKLLGVIDILASAFALVARRPWVLVLPIAIDLFLWFGPPITAEAVLKPLFASITLPPEVAADTTQNWAELKRTLETGSVNFNVLSFLTLLALGMPTLVGVLDPASAGLPMRAAWFSLNNLGTLIALAGGLAVTGILLASVYLQGVAVVVRRETLGGFFARALKAWLNVLAFIVLGMLAFMVLLVPFIMLALLASLLNQTLGAFVLISGMVLILWFALYLAFAIPAIFVGGLNVRQAALHSIAIFRFNGRSALGLLFLVYLIQIGFAVVWDLLVINPWGLAFDIVANAFLGSGLIAALMLFYHDRVEWLARWQAQAQKTATPSAKS